MKKFPFNPNHQPIERDMTHTLKTWPEYYDAIVSGKKTFEARKNDRSFQVGDTLVLQEFYMSTGYTGRETSVEVTYMMTGADGFGILGDYCVMSIRRLN